MQKSSTTPRQWVLLFSTAFILILLDQLTKAIVVHNLVLYESWVPIATLKDVFDITYTQNTGAAFGILPSASIVFLMIAIIASGVIIYYYREIPPHAWWIRLTMGIMMGGAIGNAVDRVTRGYVVDFLHLYYKPLDFDYPIFNVADTAIVAGVILLLIFISFQKEETQTPDATSGDAIEGHPEEAL